MTKDPNHPAGEAITVMELAKRIERLEHRKAVLLAFDTYWNTSLCDTTYPRLQTIADATGYPRAKVRVITRALARLGLITFTRGLFDDDGAVAGSGYGITQRGHVVAQLIKED